LEDRQVDTEKVCARCGKHCVPVQSYCPKCGSELPVATAVLASRGSLYKLILNKGGEEQIFEFESVDLAFNEALPWIMNGYIARIIDEHGVVKFTQALANRQIETYPGDATNQCRSPTPGRRPWWKFW